MKFLKSYKRKFIIFLMVCFAVMAVSYVQTISVLPGKLTLLEGEEYIYNFGSPFLVNIRADKEGVIKINNGDVKNDGSYLRLSSPVSFKTQMKGSVNLNLKFLGLIPLKKMQVDIMANKKIAACGNTVGVKLKVNGVLVIGMSDVDTLDGKKALPARDSGIKTGDLLVSINGKELESTDDLSSAVEGSQGSKVSIKLRRGGNLIDAEVTPVKSLDDKKYHIGLWVRDSTAGIGTLTFFDPDTKEFGALGHGITDIDTGALMPIEKGEILESNILAVKKGRQGSPGELKGVFVENDRELGLVTKNSECGIYGVLNDESISRIPFKYYPIAVRGQVKEGPATILANINGNEVEEFEIEVQKVSKQNISSSKGMVIRITDKRLLDSTGGIVQGMSGSPILQDGKIIGAVTHVLVNKPDTGYGIFIEWMLKNISDTGASNLKKAS